MKILVDKMPEYPTDCPFFYRCQDRCDLYTGDPCPMCEGFSITSLEEILKSYDKRLMVVEQRSRKTQSKADRLENELKVATRL